MLIYIHNFGTPIRLKKSSIRTLARIYIGKRAGARARLQVHPSTRSILGALLSFSRVSAKERKRKREREIEKACKGLIFAVTRRGDPGSHSKMAGARGMHPYTRGLFFSLSFLYMIRYISVAANRPQRVHANLLC